MEEKWNNMSKEEKMQYLYTLTPNEQLKFLNSLSDEEQNEFIDGLNPEEFENIYGSVARTVSPDKIRAIQNIRKSIKDEELLNSFDGFLGELKEEAGAGFAAMNTLYVYLTNAKDKDDLLKRLNQVNGKLQEFAKENPEASLDILDTAAKTAAEDFENGTIIDR